MTTTHAPAAPLIDQHRETLDAALKAIRERTYWSAYPEMPSEKIYGEGAKAAGEAAFKERLRTVFDLAGQPDTGETVGTEESPFGFVLGVRYPQSSADQLIAAAEAARKAWRDAGIQTRTGIALEALKRLNVRSFEMAFAVMHTSGQAFMMAFQAGGPHAQDRALEAIAYAYEAMTHVPQYVMWEKPQGKHPPIQMRKRFKVAPRGIGLVIGCSTFPTWNSYPGLFASLVTGNPVIVKPHPNAILPLALTVSVLRDVLRESGIDPNVVQLAADQSSAPLAKDLALRPEVKIIDYTGSSAFGEWLEEHARQAVVYTEKAGVNSVIVDSTTDLGAMARNIAFSLTLYSGQMCTTPQNIYIPRGGIMAGGKHVPFDEVVDAIARSVVAVTSDEAKAVEVLGAIAGDATLARLEKAEAMGDVLVPSRAVTHEHFPTAKIRTPLLLKVNDRTAGAHRTEQFGPIAFVIPTENTAESIDDAMELARTRGAITCSLYSTDSAVLHQADDAADEAGISLSANLLGNIFVNQSSAFSDFHVSGVNPAGNAALTDANFISGRFRFTQARIQPAGE
jgi:phenylacetic acid degradation protein paaN